MLLITNILLVLFVIFMVASAVHINNDFVGCYQNNQAPGLPEIFLKGHDAQGCKEICYQQHYIYAMVKKDSCFCANNAGSEFDANFCADSCISCPQKDILVDVYFTKAIVPGPPEDLKIYDITDTSAYVSWKAPKSYLDINSYEIQAKVLHTFSEIPLRSPRWTFSNNTFNTELNFQPGTKYNITIKAISKNKPGDIAYTIVETIIGYPDVIPSTPIIMTRNATIMIVQLNAVTNNNGPITAYRIAVINEGMSQILETENLKSYDKAMLEGLSYYITAEISPKNILNNFTIGDGQTYGSFFNAPLDPGSQYSVVEAVVSHYNNITRISYSNATESHNFVAISISPVPEHKTNSPVIIIGLSIAIGLLSFVFVVGIIGFYILTRRISNRRRHLTDNQELTMQGPIIEVENTAYVPEDEITPTNHYEKLKQQLWNIPQMLIKIEPTNLLGIGKFGRVNSGTVRKENNVIPAAIYTISDRVLGHIKKRAMLKDLDLLIRSGNHDNVLKLIGTCESPDTLFIVLEYASMNLKDLLLGSRDTLPGRFSNMQESQALDISIGIVKGMMHLESLKILHKQLCARNILITNGFIPKVSGYGICQYFNPNMVPDYTRWTAAEVLQSQQYALKCDIWSFACLLWEICVLGGTPYGTVPNNEIPERVIRGLRLVQLKYISDELYQLMLNCWQLDLDERPTFKDLVNVLYSIRESELPYLSFNMYPDFQYEQFHPNMELAARTIH